MAQIFYHKKLQLQKRMNVYKKLVNQPKVMLDFPPGGILGLNIPEGFSELFVLSVPNTICVMLAFLGSKVGNLELN